LKAGIGRYRELYSKRLKRKAEIVISSAGGVPQDLCFESASRSLFNAAGGLREGGAILLLAECRDGMGSPALRDLFASHRSRERLEELLEREPSEEGIYSYLLMGVFEEFKVLLVSALPEALLRPLKIRAFRSANSALESAKRALGEDSKICAIANASKNFLSLAADGQPGGGPQWTP
jgi:nickel-dependent lactate racemase